MLHEDKELFEKVVLDASEKFDIVPVIIEKDYYVTLFLREIVRKNPNIIFKGGTSLSKCYHIINRFSEDIDLNIDVERRPTEGQRKSLVNDVRKIINSFDFTLKNPEEIHSRREYNKFEIDVHSIFSSEYIKHDLIVETAVFFRSYPSVKLQATSYIFEYLKSISREDIIEDFALEPFEIQVQALERTFVDKLFAICDYYLSNKIDEHSRHLYDLYKMSEKIVIDEALKKLFDMVRQERKERKTCLSAQDGIVIKDCIQQIISNDVFKKDYETVTMSLIFDNVNYKDAKENLQNIANSF